MTKHVKYILYFIATFILIITAGLVLLTSQFFKFYNSYIEEEKEELDHQVLLVEWAITPILQKYDTNKLKEFCSELKDDDIAIFIQNSKGKLLASSRYDLDFNNVKLDLPEKKTYKSYEYTIKDKMIAKEKQITVNNEEYTIKIALLQDNMVKTFLKNQQSIIWVFLTSILIIIAISIYGIISLKLPFDKLQKSAKRIQEGDFEAKIPIIEKGMLSEHSKTINNMAEQLKQKIKALELMQTQKNEMLSGFSHEVKTPLTSILLATELLTQNSNNEEKDNCLNIIKKNSERLNSLILSIIDIADLEHKNIQQKREFNEFLLEDSIYAAIDNAKILTDKIKINFNIKNHITIFADSIALESAILNILTNAIKYSKSDKIDITLLKDNENAIISVKDYGIGIAPEHLDKIFDKFYRVDKNRSRDLGGNGLGLSIVKQIIEMHNGKITVVSNKGCEFIITLPITQN